MTRIAATGAYPAAPVRPAWGIVAVPTLVLAGYLGVADLRVAAIVVGMMVLAGWAALAWRHPRAVLAASFPLVLLAGTKFRVRDADASLAGAIDTQVMLELGLYGLIGAGVLAAWMALPDRRRLTTVEGIVAGYAAVALASTLWSVVPALTLVRAAQLAVLAGLAIASVRALRPGAALWTAGRAVAIFSLGCAAVALLVPTTVTLRISEDPGRFAWFAAHPIDAGTLCAIGLLCMAATALFRHDPSRPSRVLGLPAAWYALPLLIILVMTSSRGPLLACAAGFGVLVLVRLAPAARIALVLAGLSCVLVYPLTGVNLPSTLEAATRHDSALSRVLLRSQDVGTVLELNGRLRLWEDLTPAITANAIAGYGYQASRPVVLDAAPWAAYAHNALLQALLDLGLLGTAPLLVIIGVALSAGGRRRLLPWTGATLAAVTVFLVLNSISTESFAGAPGIETLLLLVCALAAASRDLAPASEELR